MKARVQKMDCTIFGATGWDGTLETGCRRRQFRVWFGFRESQMQITRLGFACAHPRSGRPPFLCVLGVATTNGAAGSWPDKILRRAQVLLRMTWFTYVSRWS